MSKQKTLITGHVYVISKKVSKYYAIQLKRVRAELCCTIITGKGVSCLMYSMWFDRSSRKNTSCSLCLNGWLVLLSSAVKIRAVSLLNSQLWSLSALYGCAKWVFIIFLALDSFISVISSFHACVSSYICSFVFCHHHQALLNMPLFWSRIDCCESSYSQIHTDWPLFSTVFLSVLFNHSPITQSTLWNI